MADPTKEPSPGNDSRSATGGRSLRQAVATALVLIGLIAGAAALGSLAFFVLICVVVLIALFEMLDGVAQAGHRPNLLVGLGAGAAMLIVGYVQRPVYLVVILLAAMYAAFVWGLRTGRGSHAAGDVAWTLLGLGWVAGGGVGATSILVLEPDGLWLLIGSVLVIALDDIGAYFAGSRWGRHKLAPSISPGKSWEGVAGGATLAVAGGAVFGTVYGGLSVVEGFGIGILAATFAPVGDLIESLFKREVGIKDSGRLLPGHGGLLDRLDAIVFCAPIVYLYIRWVVV